MFFKAKFPWIPDYIFSLVFFGEPKFPQKDEQ